MTKPSAALLLQLLKNKEYQREIVASGGLSEMQLKIRDWQAHRLAKTYSDFALMKRYSAATDFFEQHLYGPADFTQRDADIERVYPIMAKVLSDQALRSITLAIELHVLTQELDRELEAQVSQRITEEDPITAEVYAESYQACANQERRARQIHYLLDIGEVLDQVVTHPVLYATIKIARIPAKIAGFDRLQEFVESGFSAFKRMKGAEEFLKAIHDRETEIMERLFKGDGMPGWAVPGGD